jgi:hypothetical protein
MTTWIGTTDGSLFYTLRPPLFFRHDLTSKETGGNVRDSKAWDFYGDVVPVEFAIDGAVIFPIRIPGV